MKLVTRNDIRDQAVRLKEHWARASPDWRGSNGRTHQQAADAIKALGDDPDLGDVAEIAENTSFRLECNECGMDADALVEFTRETMDEVDSVQLCLDCLKKAVTLIADK